MSQPHDRPRGGPRNRRRGRWSKAWWPLAIGTALVACSADAPPISAPSTTAAPATTALDGSAATSTTASMAASAGSTPAVEPVTPSSTSAPIALPTGDGDLAGARVKLTRVADLTEPVAFAFRPKEARPGTVYVVERAGVVRALGPDGRLADRAVLDMRSRTTAGGERGLLGLAFSPDGARLYVNYTDSSGDTNVDEYVIGSDGAAEVATRRRVLFQDQPFANHNGGHLVFGPDGMLYIGLGDGGSSGDPQGNGQDLGTWLGKMLRIDPTPSGGAAYTVPPDNPFVGRAGAKPEIWSYGLRNPWRYAFDPATGDLWIGDVGQNNIEEIDVARAGVRGTAPGKGANYGWNAFEGSLPFAADVDAPGAVTPFHEYAHSGGLGGCSVTGGFVYRGTRIPALAGAYVFADYCVAGIRAIPSGGTAQPDAVALLAEPASVASFGEGPDGELYVLSLAGGAVYRIDPAG